MKAKFYPTVLILAGFLGGSAVKADSVLDRGAYLVNAVAACGDCHTQRGPKGPGPELAGGMKFGDPSIYTAYAANLTPDADTGLGTWTDAQIMRAFREGVRPDGTIIGAPMPIEFYRGISDEDAVAIVAFLRSVPAVKNKVPPSTYKVPPKSWGPAVGQIAAVSPDDPIKYGAYLAGPVAHCMECHTPGGDYAHELGAGGNTFTGGYGTSVSADITPAGIAKYSDDELVKIIRTGIRPDGTHLKPPMGVAAYSKMTNPDVSAIIAYLRSLPPK